jgi:peptide/nickel transport system ATP-binding protein
MNAKAASEQKNTLLEVKNLSVEYLTPKGAVHAANDISFTLERGQILGVVGESGSGKSTMAYAIARLHQPPAMITGGEVLYYGGSVGARFSVPREGQSKKDDEQEDDGPVDVLKLTPRQLRAFRWSELAVVFQSAMNALNPVMTIERQISDVIKAHRPTIGRDMLHHQAIELLRLVGISKDRLRSYPHELSGGMRQRTTIAIALALNPDLIIMDEPTTALDVVVQRDILKQIMALRKEFGFSVIFITHDLSLLLEMADSLIIMYAGRIVETAQRRDLYSHPLHPYTYGLLNSFPSLRGPQRTMRGIPGSPPDLRRIPSGCAFRTRCAFAFPACAQQVPSFYTPRADHHHHDAACFLYDQMLHPGGPPEHFEKVGGGKTAEKSDPVPGQNSSQPLKGGRLS